jgi:hypothetical protein
MKIPKGILVPAEDLPKYRDRTLAMLRRYFRISLEVGRLPSLLGRECFRAKVTSYRLRSFEDAVIFVHDIERCLTRLDRVSQRLIAKIVFENYDYAEAAIMCACTWRTVANRFPAAIDALTRLFLELNLMEPIPCQPPKNEENGATN